MFFDKIESKYEQMNNTYIITGFYGSGKTEFSINLALNYSNKSHSNKSITLADLDVINPYVRSRERQTELANMGIRIVASSLNNHTSQDVPAISFGFTDDIVGDNHVIIDLGGSEAGTKVLPGFAQYIQQANFFCVLNPFRPETDTSKKMIDFIRLINATAPIKINGLVNNGHMLNFTEADHVLFSQKIVTQVSKELDIPIVYTQIHSKIYEQISDQIISQKVLVFDKLNMRESWQ